MDYTNDRIKELKEQQRLISLEIEKEIQKEKARYKFSWKRFLILVAVMLMPLYVYINVKVFPDTSIWSWKHYVNTGFTH
mgnify:FL=1